MPICKKHNQSYSHGDMCPDCARNALVKGKDKGKTTIIKMGVIRTRPYHKIPVAEMPKAQ